MRPPSLYLALTEAPRTLLEYQFGSANACLLGNSPRGDGHRVIVIPGFLGTDALNERLVRFLCKLGYNATGWEMGRNLGPNRSPIETLSHSVADIADTEGVVSLIGHSLGGIYARELARRMPNKVRQVFTLGSPFGDGHEEGTWASGLFKRLNPESETSTELTLLKKHMANAPPVPTTAIYSKGDGVVNWRTSVQENGHEQAQNIQVLGSHCGLTLNTAVWYLLAERLPLKKEAWVPFKSAVFNHH